MKQLLIVERCCLMGHFFATAFGLGGLLLVLPNPDFIATLSELGQLFFRWGMAGGGAFYMVLGAIAVALYAYRTLGLRHCLTFLLPAVFLSLGSELLGTSTGFPFGYYGYLEGLGYKIAGLVPFTIPLSWFYVGFSAYVIARSGLEALYLKFSGQSVESSTKRWSWVALQAGAIVLGSLFLTAWDLVLDFAMSQDSIRFWEWRQAGAFFGMPYQNFVGWIGTGALFMTVAACFWGLAPLALKRFNLLLPLGIYLINFAFGAIITASASVFVPVLLGTLLGLVPVLVFWWLAGSVDQNDRPLLPTIPNRVSELIKPVAVGFSSRKTAKQPIVPSIGKRA